MEETYEEKKYLDLDMLALYDAMIKSFIGNSINGKIFIGTHAEYQTAYDNGQIPINALVILTDDESSGGGSGGDDPTSSTTSMLGYAVLGQMVLG